MARAAFEALGPSFRVHDDVFAGSRVRWIEGGDATKRPVVLLHGRGNAAISWHPLLRAFAGKFRLFALDMPGHGRSELAPARGEPLERFAAPVRAWMREVPGKPFSIAAHSLGAYVAAALALEPNSPIQSLVLIAAMGIGPSMRLPARAFFKWGPERLARRLGPERYLRWLSQNDEHGRLGLELLLAEPREETRRAFAALFPWLGAVPHLAARLATTPTPTLLIQGSRDEVFPPSNARSLAKQSPIALVELDAGHGPQSERLVDVEQALVRFLR